MRVIADTPRGDGFSRTSEAWTCEDWELEQAARAAQAAAHNAKQAALLVAKAGSRSLASSSDVGTSMSGGRYQEGRSGTSS